MTSNEVVADAELNDFSCYITIKNDTDVDFGLSRFGINDGYGVWPRGQPVNTIEAHQHATVYLKDPKFVGGSDGWVEYEVPVGDRTETFRLEFSDPEALWSENTLEAQSSNPELLVATVEPYETSGHPLRGIVNVTRRGSKKEVEKMQHPATSIRNAPSTAASDNSPIKPNYDIGFETPIVPIITKSPIHESISIAAFIQSNLFFPKGTTYNNLNIKQWEYIRGIVWNDDPSCYLFLDRLDDNHSFSDGLKWYMAYSGGDTSSIIKRSHMGDLQFLHGMAVTVGEEPEETQRKILKWLEVMYKLACGNQGVSAGDQLKHHLGEWFNDNTKPSGQDTIRDLLLSSTPSYVGADIRKRALGVCIHIITDSYAVGHTQRRLVNPDSYQGRTSENFMSFKPGMYGKWGPVVVFHSYDGQDKGRHSHYDGKQDDGLPVPGNLESFNSIIGARSAIEADTKLINFFAAGTKWEDGVRSFLAGDIFAIGKTTYPADDQVDETGPYTSDSGRIGQPDVEYDYEAALQRKSMSLEAGADVFTEQYRRRIGKDCIFAVLLFAVGTGIFAFSLISSCINRVSKDHESPRQIH